MKRLLRTLCLACLTLALALPAWAEGTDPGLSPNWYEVFVRSYRDSNGDGLGDLNGLREKLDYIRDMGWGGLWLMTVMPVPPTTSTT